MYRTKLKHNLRFSHILKHPLETTEKIDGQLMMKTSRKFHTFRMSQKNVNTDAGTIHHTSNTYIMHQHIDYNRKMLMIFKLFIGTLWTI